MVSSAAAASADRRSPWHSRAADKTRRGSVRTLPRQMSVTSSAAAGSVHEQHQQDDDRDRNADKPEKDRAHGDVPFVLMLSHMTLRSRSCPPSIAPRLAQNAP